MDMHPSPDELRKMIDETLAEIEELEADVREMFSELLGPEAAQKIEAYKRAQAAAPRLEALSVSGDRADGASPPLAPETLPRRCSPESPTKEASSEPSTAPPATP